MCIIAIKPAGIKRPTNKQFENMCTANPNGFGYMTWSKEEGLIVKKTMSKKTYMKWVKNIPDEQAVVYHMRIATHGSVNENNCHPFLSDDHNWAFAHNGVLGIKNEGDMTDSETFFKRLAIPLLKVGFKPRDNGDFDAMVDAIIGSSKFVFMDKNGKLYSYGNFIHDGELYFSNSSYQSYDYRSCIKFDYCKDVSSKNDILSICDDDGKDDVIDIIVEELYYRMMNDPFFFDKNRNELWEGEYKEFITYEEFDQAYSDAEMWLYEDMNNFYYQP